MYSPIIDTSLKLHLLHVFKDQSDTVVVNIN